MAKRGRPRVARSCTAESALDGPELPRRSLRDARVSPRPKTTSRSCRKRPSPRSSTSSGTDRRTPRRRRPWPKWKRRCGSTTTCRRGCRRRSSPTRARGGVLPVAPGFGLRHRQRQHRHQRRRDRRRIRWREGDRRRPRVRLGRVEGLHAASDQHGELEHELPLAQGIEFG